MATASNTPRVPWYESVTRSVRAKQANCFVLHGNSVNDYAYQARTHERHLLLSMLREQRIVVKFSLATGITWPADEAMTPDDEVLTRDHHHAEAVTLLAEAKAREEEARYQRARAKWVEECREAQRTGKPLPPEPKRPGMQGASSAAAGALAALGNVRPATQSGPVQADDPFLAVAGNVRASLALLERLASVGNKGPRGYQGVTILIDYADLLMPNGDKATMPPDRAALLATLQDWGKSGKLLDAGALVFLFAPTLSDLHSDLRASGSGYKAVEIKLPNREERAAFIQWWMQDLGEGIECSEELSANGYHLFATLTAGLTLRQVEDVMLLGEEYEGGITRELVRTRKNEIIRQVYGDIAKMIEPNLGGLDAIGGMSNIKAYFRAEVIPSAQAGSKDTPKGLLFVGPPGGGKTDLLAALAQETGFNAVELQASRIKGKYVGETEKALERFLAFVAALTPAIVFMDEIDQSFGRRATGGEGDPTQGNTFGTILTTLSDESYRGKVIFIGATNKPSNLDPALKRSGRMDAIIPFLAPSEEERAEILLVQAERQGVSLSKPLAKRAASATPYYMGADLFAIIFKAARLAKRGGHTGTLTPEDVEQALSFIQPDTSQVQAYTIEAVEACNDAEFLPEWARAKLTPDRSILREELAEAREATTPRSAAELADTLPEERTRRGRR